MGQVKSVPEKSARFFAVCGDVRSPAPAGPAAVSNICNSGEMMYFISTRIRMREPSMMNPMMSISHRKLSAAALALIFITMLVNVVDRKSVV